MFGLIFLDNGGFDFFPIVDDIDWQWADTIFHSTFFVDGNFTGADPTPDAIAAFQAFLAA